MVRTEFRYGMCTPRLPPPTEPVLVSQRRRVALRMSPKDLITSPRTERDLLMLFASFSRVSFAPERVTRSDPARSTRWILPAGARRRGAKVKYRITKERGVVETGI